MFCKKAVQQFKETLHTSKEKQFKSFTKYANHMHRKHAPHAQKTRITCTEITNHSTGNIAKAKADHDLILL